MVKSLIQQTQYSTEEFSIKSHNGRWEISTKELMLCPRVGCCRIRLVVVPNIKEYTWDVCDVKFWLRP